MQNPQIMGIIFENLLAKCLQKVFGSEAVFCPNRPNNREVRTARGDGGTDIYLTVPGNGPSSLFGIPVIPGRKYFVEAKYVENGALSYEKCAPNLSQMQNNLDICGIFIVTNSFLYASTYFNIINNFPRISGKINVVDGYCAGAWFDYYQVPISSGIRIHLPKNTQNAEKSNLSIQTSSDIRRHIEGDNKTELRVFYFAAHNRGDTEQNLDIVIQTDVNWRFIEREDSKKPSIDDEHGFEWRKTLYIPPWQTVTLRIFGEYIPKQAGVSISRQYRTKARQDGARIVAEIDQKIIPLFDGIPPIRQIYKTTFTGCRNEALRDELKKAIEIDWNNKSAALHVIHISGEAGVGKSRLVDEFLPPSGDSAYPIFHHTIDASIGAGNKEHWTRIRNRLSEFFLESSITAFPNDVTDVPKLIGAMLGPVQQVSDLGKWANIILVIEDLHHASKDVCDSIRRAIQNNREMSVNVTVILTARNDDSYVNLEYKKLAAELMHNELVSGKGIANIVNRVVNPLSNDEAWALISSLIDGIQSTGIDRILRLSNTIPHNIIQCIEYLMDASLLAITSRGTLSIVDMQTFEKRSASLPQTMEDLFTARFENLRALPGRFGEAAQEAILAATVFGTYFSSTIGALVDGVDEKMVCEELINRRFFAKSKANEGFDNTLEWHHENLLLFFGNHRMAQAQSVGCKAKISAISKRFITNAKLIRQKSSVWDTLSGLRQGAVAAVAGDYPVARDKFSEMIFHAESVKTFSTLDAPTIYFDHVEYAVLALRSMRSHRRNEQIWKLLILKCFIGGYHKGLRFGEQAFKYVCKIIHHLSLPEKTIQRGLIWARVIDAQVHLDSGFVGAALDRFMHLMPDIRLAELGGADADATACEDWEMLFDIYNCMRLLFTYANFSALAEINGTLAEQCIRRSNVKMSEDMGLGDKALFMMLTNRKECVNLLQMALELNKKQGSQRHGWHSGISLIAAELVDYRCDAQWLGHSAARTDEYITTCEEQSYYSILPRIYLLKAVIEYLLGCIADKDNDAIKRENYFDAALAHSKKGLAACELYSIGFILWQLRNINAIILFRRNQKMKSREELETAMNIIEQEGLTFMGRDGVVSAVPIVIANYVKSQPTDSRIRAFLAKIHGFEAYEWSAADIIKSDKYLIEIKRLATRFHHIIPGQEYTPDGLIIDELSNMAVVYWF